jgi:hypothetical protein
MRIRKQVYELSAQDLEKYPVWEYALDEENQPDQDEATVRPLQELPADPEDRSQVMLAIILNLVDGTSSYGLINCPTKPEWDMSDLLPSMLVSDGMVSFWQGVRVPSWDTISNEYRRIGKTAEQVFPASFRTLVEIDGHALEGVIEGFYHYDWLPGRRMYPFKQYLNLKRTI